MNLAKGLAAAFCVFFAFLLLRPLLEPLSTRLALKLFSFGAEAAAGRDPPRARVLLKLPVTFSAEIA